MKSWRIIASIVLTQLPVVKGAVADNLVMHLAYIEHAANHGADVIVFPELSLTGYESDLLERLAMPEDADVFTALCAAATAKSLVCVINDGVLDASAEKTITMEDTARSRGSIA